MASTSQRASTVSRSLVASASPATCANQVEAKLDLAFAPMSKHRVEI
jgi:hypothetical protein